MISVADYDVYSISYYYPDPATIYLTDCNANNAAATLQSSISRTDDNSWYSVMKNYSQMAHDYGKELYCYEGGVGCDPTDSCIGNYCYSGGYSLQQHLPLMKNIEMQVFDSLTSLGFDGGNELQFVGTLWKRKAIKCSAGYFDFWGLVDNVDANKIPVQNTWVFQIV